jgi:hypothetical protein
MKFLEKIGLKKSKNFFHCANFFTNNKFLLTFCNPQSLINYKTKSIEKKIDKKSLMKFPLLYFLENPVKYRKSLQQKIKLRDCHTCQTQLKLV